MSYEADRVYGERFVPLVRVMAGPHLLQPSPFEVDAKQAADLVVLRADALTLGVRIRRPGYAERYPFDFTIRSKRDTGSETELAKVCNGWMDWMFYGHGDGGDGDPQLYRWMLIDMSVWRREGIRHGWKSLRDKGLLREKSNGDGTHFVACDVRRWPADLLVAASENVASAVAA